MVWTLVVRFDAHAPVGSDETGLDAAGEPAAPTRVRTIELDSEPGPSTPVFADHGRRARAGRRFTVALLVAATVTMAAFAGANTTTAPARGTTHITTEPASAGVGR